MKYVGTFKDRLNKEHTVTIVTDAAGTEVALTLGTPPFTVDMNTDGDTLYKNAKYQAATIKYVAANEKYDMYAATAQQNKVTLTDASNNIEWIGYIEPNSYSQDYEGYDGEIELNAIDALATLQYYKYDPIGDEKAVITFKELLFHLLQKCNAYKYMYVSDNVKLSSSSTTPIIDTLVISESNFYDEKNDGETDEDVAWTYQDVLEETAQFLGMTVIAWGDSVYIIDYDSIKGGNNTYWRYDLTLGGYSKVTLSSPIAIDGEMIVHGGQTVGLGDVYNKVSIKADTNTFESAIPSLYDNLINITKGKDDTLTSSTSQRDGIYGEVIQSPIGETETDSGNMLVMIQRAYNPQKGNYKNPQAVAVKYYKNPYYKFYSYNGTTLDNGMNYTDSKSYYGAFIAKFFVQHVDGLYSGLFEQVYPKKTLDEIFAQNDITNISLTNYLCLMNPSPKHLNPTQMAMYPFLETVASDGTALFGGKNAYLLIKGSLYFHYFDNNAYPIPDGESDISEGRRYYKDASEGYLLAKLQWGNLFWNGEKWTNEGSITFHLPYVKPTASSSERRADALMFKDNDFVNTVNWRLGITDKGYLIKCPEDNIVAGLPRLTLFSPYDPIYNKDGRHYPLDRVFLKDFDIKAIIADPTFSEAMDTDTEYTNVISKDNVKELNEISWKINTYDNKKPSFSCVGYKDYDSKGLKQYHFLDKTYNVSTAKGEADWESSDPDAPKGGLRQEEHAIYKLVNQYSTPSINLNITVDSTDIRPWSKVSEKFMGAKTFIIDTLSIDYENASTTLTLVEKK